MMIMVKEIGYNRNGLIAKLIFFRNIAVLNQDETLKQEIPAADIALVEPAGVPAPPSAPLSRWQRFWRWEYTGLLIIILVTLGFHFAAIERPKTIIWDEKWYVGDARSIITGGGDVRPEHPPLAKLFIVAGEFIFNGFKVPEKDTGAVLSSAVGNDETVLVVNDASDFTAGMNIRLGKEQMNVTGADVALDRVFVERDTGGTGKFSHLRGAQIFVFTDNAFGWRFFPIVFGTLGILVFYFVCRRLNLSPRTALIATFLFALEDMTFIHSGTALLDVFMVTFLLVAVYLYLNESYLLSAVFVALSAQCKLIGVLILIAMALHFLIYRRKKWAQFVGSFLVAGVSYVAFLVIFDFLITGGLGNPVERITAMLSGTSANVFTDPKLSISSYPWTWIYPQFVQVYYNSPNVPFIAYSYDPQYISFISSTIQILILPAIGYMIYKAVKGSRSACFIVLWFLATYLVWIPLVLVTNRVTFVFYFLPTIPAICIAIAMAISDMLGWLKKRRERLGRLTPGVITWYCVIGLYFTIHLAIFVVLNPAIPTLIKTWEPPFGIGVDPTVAGQSLHMLAADMRYLLLRW
jgi:dolichyl-phosphate-mannose--protein O-mannosyl transferase